MLFDKEGLDVSWPKYRTHEASPVVSQPAASSTPSVKNGKGLGG